jgi:hypothetical protein
MSEETLEEKDSLEEQDEQPEDGEQNEEEKTEAVPLSKYMKEKKQRQEAERKQKEIAQKLAEYEAAKERTDTENRYVQDGVDEKTAKFMAAQDARLARIEEASIEIEIDALSQKELYADAKENANVIKEAMKKYDVTAEQAYMMKLWTPLKAKEFTEKRAQLALYNKDAEQEIDPGPSGSKKPTSLYTHWTDSDKAAFNALREKNSSWTKEQYNELMYKEE